MVYMGLESGTEEGLKTLHKLRAVLRDQDLILESLQRDAATVCA